MDDPFAGGALELTSLLWPAGSGLQLRTSVGLAETAAEDLAVAELVRAIVGADGTTAQVQRREHYVRQMLGQLIADAAVIGYRQDVVQDLLDNSALSTQLAAVLPALESLSDVGGRAERFQATSREVIERVVRRLADLELYVDCTRQLVGALTSATLHSTALRAVRTDLQRLVESETFSSLEAQLPELRETLAGVRSVTIGLNLGPDLMPESATILEFGSQRIDGRRALLGRLLGDGGQHGLTPLRRGEGSPMGRPNDLQRDLNRLLQEVVAPLAAALARYSRLSVHGLARLGPELALLLGGARLATTLQAVGLPVCRPQILAADERVTDLGEAYDPGLVLRAGGEDVVTNAVVLDADQARIWVLCGPNRSGKTTYIRAVGLAHLLGQAGLPVPARSARLSPVDAVFTHFPAREANQPGMGRLDQEADRLAAIFRQATRHSLVLLNEALAGTSALEAFDLARGVVRGLRLLGARAIYVTHLHELAAAAAEINASTAGDARVGSLVAEPGASGAGALVRSYRISPGPPHGQSFAAEIAAQHGISYEQLVALLNERGLTGD
jgi:DNA mismatch repair ATPase MutS